MWIEWTGQRPRDNAYGSFKPHEPVEVPEHVGRALLTNGRFMEVDESKVKLLQGDDNQLAQRLRAAVDEIEHLQAEVNNRDLVITELQDMVDAYKAMDAAGPGIDPTATIVPTEPTEPTAEDEEGGEEDDGPVD